MTRTDFVAASDCLDWLAELGDGEADHAFTDPPYSEHVHAKSLRSNTRTSKAKRRARVEPKSRDLGFDALTPALQRDVACELARVVRRWVGVFCNVELVSPWIYALQGAGLDYVRTCPWIKPNSAPQFSGDRPAAGWECIVLAHRKGAKRWNSGGKRGVYTHAIETGARAAGRINATEKPVPLLVELVDDFTDEGELVIDPFAGSGSTGVACVRRRRRFAGCELRDEQAMLANRRIADELVAVATLSTVDAVRAGQAPLFGGEVST